MVGGYADLFKKLLPSRATYLAIRGSLGEANADAFMKTVYGRAAPWQPEPLPMNSRRRR